MSDIKKVELLPCPFCGGEGKLETMLYGGTAVSCQNTDCGFYGYNVETSMWNTRPNDAKKMIAEGLEDYVSKLEKEYGQLYEEAKSDYHAGLFDQLQTILIELRAICKQSSEGE